MIKRLYLLCFSCVLFASATVAQISLVQFATGFSSPVDIKNCGDNRLFIVEQAGRIKILDTAGVVKTVPFLDIVSRVQLSSEEGLLGLAFPADFQTSGYFYVDYVGKLDHRTHISRFHVDPATPDSADPASEEILLTIYQPYSNHKGGHVAFGPDGYLYVGMGDGGAANDPQNRAQNPDSLLGKMLRLEVDPAYPGYKIPPTNAFASDTTQGRGEIFTLGMRNPWRFSFDRLTGDLWIGDVGQNLIEEVDMQPAGTHGGLNYGWRCYEAQAYFDTSAGCHASYVLPVYSYNHSPGGYCSISGGYVYRGALYQELYGKYFYADYCNSQIQYLKDSAGGYVNTNLGSLGASSVSTFGEDRRGELYCASVGNGRIYRFESANCAPVATINSGLDTINDCGTGSVNLEVPSGDGFSYLWTLNGDTVFTGASFSATQTGMYILNVTNQTCSNSDSVYVELITPLNVTFTGLDTLYCVYNSSVNLSPNYLGGSFDGAGVIGATFFPSVAGVGQFSILYTYTDPTGCTYAHAQGVRVDACLNVPDNVWTNTIEVFPNPSNGNFIIHAYPQVEKKMNVEIMDLTGKRVWNETFILTAEDHTIPVQPSLANGVYTIRFTDEYSSSSHKLIIQ